MTGVWFVRIACDGCDRLGDLIEGPAAEVRDVLCRRGWTAERRGRFGGWEDLCPTCSGQAVLDFEGV